MKQEFLHIDATPDESYPIRILRAYRRLGDYKWSDSSNDVSENNVLVKTMNELQEKRNALLDRATALLATQHIMKEEELTIEEIDMLLTAMNAWYSEFYVGVGWKVEGDLEGKLERMKQHLLTPVAPDECPCSSDKKHDFRFYTMARVELCEWCGARR